MTTKIERFQPEGTNVRMSAGQPSYSQVVTVSGTDKVVFIAGQLARDIDGNCVGKGDMHAQMEQTFQNLDKCLRAAGATWAVRCQLKTRLAFTPWRRAISATEAPGKRASVIISRFSSSDHDRRDRLETGAELDPCCADIAEFNDTDPTVRSGNVHYRLMDISPISSGAGIILELAQTW